MIMADASQAKEMITRCLAFREVGRPEAVLRSEIQSRLRLIFSAVEDETWINHYSAGTEAHTMVGTGSGKVSHRFIDNLVGSTTIEYEADLRIPAKRDEGFHQVREHAAGLIRSGTPAAQVRGILSDTLDWYAYDIVVATDVNAAHCTATDVTLQLVDELQIAAADDDSAHRLIAFIRRHLAREQSRQLKADLLSIDLGLVSHSYRRNADTLLALVDAGRKTDPSIELATGLWSAFVDYLESTPADFRAEAYVDEVYLCVLARLLSANVLAEKAILSSDAEIKAILDGSHFYDRYQLINMVELDYFGWLTNAQHIGTLLPVAKSIQHDLYAYDFSRRPEEDLFGRLMAQLARRAQRKLLGQEWTPEWLARLLAETCIGNLPTGERPRIVDMCCGSGTILAEVLKVARDKLGLSGIGQLHDVVTGFDIDPLAVSLSKTTWVVTLAAEIKTASAPIAIPIYHADSLFAVTPVSPKLPFFGDEDEIEISLDGEVIKLPSEIVQPAFLKLFDRIIDWAYDEARDAPTKGTGHLTEHITRQFIAGAAENSGTAVSKDLLKNLIPAVHRLTCRMAELAIANRNGIWAFILRNTYRPGLLSGQFNGLVSNPPWLAMSGLADNPYRGVLTDRAKLYGIRPSGESFLHLELGTTHLLHAVDRYLEVGASVACLVPGTVFNGNHHEHLRRRDFLHSSRPVALEITQVWQVAPGTFKYPGAAIIGRKHAGVKGLTSKHTGGSLALPSGLEKADFSVRNLGTKRTAWILEKGGLPIAAGGMKDPPQQGADLMPRTAVCIEILNQDNSEYRVDTPTTGSTWGFVVKAAKELKDARFAGHVAPRFIHRIAQSENLLPFLLGSHCAPIAIPAERGQGGEWQIYADADIRHMGLTQTARRFRKINEQLQTIGKGKSLQERIDERGKLSKQVFGDGGYIVIVGAGGKYICAACIPVAEAAGLVIDQTLYWKSIPSASAAWFYVGMLNSHALTQAIMPFNPKGAFGERHIHALPYRIMPAFDPTNDDHLHIGTLAQEIAAMAAAEVDNTPYLKTPSSALTVRRSKLRKALSNTQKYAELEDLCAAVLGTSPSYEGSEENEI